MFEMDRSADSNCHCPPVIMIRIRWPSLCSTCPRSDFLAIQGLQVTQDRVKTYHVDFVYYTDVTSHIMTALTGATACSWRFFPWNYITTVSSLPNWCSQQTRTRDPCIFKLLVNSAPGPGTLMTFINPLSVENHDFDGMELGSYIVYWSMIKYHVIDDWRSISLESIYTGSFPGIQPHPNTSTLKDYELPQALFSHDHNGSAAWLP